MANVIKIKRGAEVPTTNAQLAPGEIGFNTTDDSLYMNKGTDTTPDIVRVGEDANSILTKIKTVDGASSGLDADLLDGKHASDFALTSHNQAWSTITSRPADNQFPNTAEAIGASKNLNNYTTPGFYYQSANANASTANNYPVARAGTLIVTKDAGTTQMYYEYNGSGVYYRTFYSSTWTAWQNLVAPTWANVSSKPAQATRWPTWSEVTSKPTTFAPSSHNHAASNITSGSLSVARGGTGRATLTSNTVLVGNGTSAVSMVSRSGIDSRSSFPPATHTHSRSTTTLRGAVNIAAGTNYTVSQSILNFDLIVVNCSTTYASSGAYNHDVWVFDPASMPRNVTGISSVGQIGSTKSINFQWQNTTTLRVFSMNNTQSPRIISIIGIKFTA